MFVTVVVGGKDIKDNMDMVWRGMKDEELQKKKLAGLLLTNQIFTTLARATKESSYQLVFIFIFLYKLFTN